MDKALQSYIVPQLQERGYNIDVTEEGSRHRYRYTAQDGTTDEVGWLARTSGQYMPVVISLGEDEFTTTGGLTGKVFLVDG